MATRALYVLLAVAACSGQQSAGYRTDANYDTANESLAPSNSSADAAGDQMEDFPMEDLSPGATVNPESWMNEFENSTTNTTDSTEPEKVFMNVSDTVAPEAPSGALRQDAAPQQDLGPLVNKSGNVSELSDLFVGSGDAPIPSHMDDDQVGSGSTVPDASGQTLSTTPKPDSDVIAHDNDTGVDSVEDAVEDASVPAPTPPRGVGDDNSSLPSADEDTSPTPRFYNPRLAQRVQSYNRSRMAAPLPPGMGLDAVIASVLDADDPYGSFAAGYRHGTCRAKVASLIKIGQRTRTVKVI
jgi:hypothetical protein